jgi:hypothetical protein
MRRAISIDLNRISFHQNRSCRGWKARGLVVYGQSSGEAVFRYPVY